MRIESDRLYIYPISNEEMKKMIADEKDEGLRQAYSEMLQGCINSPENRIWYAVWNMELKDRPGTIVDDLSFKGFGNGGIVEIGYGLRDGYCGNGNMSEALKRISEWAVGQEGVMRIEAETSPDNTASQKVLSNVGYVPTGEIGEEGPRFVYAL